MSLSGRTGVAAASSVGQAARAVLLTADPRAKAMAARAAARAWAGGRLAHRFDVAMPDTPPRPDRPPLVAPHDLPRRKRGGSERSRIALLHAFAHIEYVAIDLAFDCAGRFGEGRPPGFVGDWFDVGADEAMHFALLDRRLKALGLGYGTLPAHDGLWEAAGRTRDDALARLAIVPMAFEARGLDVTPATADRFAAHGDDRSARILMRIFHDEIRHVAVGERWFRRGCETVSLGPADTWKRLVSARFPGVVKPPFNDSARRAAGLTLDYYGTLATAD